jgi:hypothetical protein
MDLHVRKLFWTADGWPVASPERYAWEGDSAIAQPSLVGDWENKKSTIIFTGLNKDGMAVWGKKK